MGHVKFRMQMNAQRKFSRVIEVSRREQDWMAVTFRIN